jgi:hypothetical protein
VCQFLRLLTNENNRLAMVSEIQREEHAVYAIVDK